MHTYIHLHVSPPHSLADCLCVLLAPFVDMLMPCPLVCLSAQHTQHTHTHPAWSTLPTITKSNIAPLSPSLSVSLSAPPLRLHSVPCICNWLSLVATLRIYISTYQ